MLGQSLYFNVILGLLVLLSGVKKLLVWHGDQLRVYWYDVCFGNYSSTSFSSPDYQIHSCWIFEGGIYAGLQFPSHVLDNLIDFRNWREGNQHKKKACHRFHSPSSLTVRLLAAIFSCQCFICFNFEYTWSVEMEDTDGRALYSFLYYVYFPSFLGFISCMNWRKCICCLPCTFLGNFIYLHFSVIIFIILVWILVLSKCFAFVNTLWFHCWGNVLVSLTVFYSMSKGKNNQNERCSELIISFFFDHACIVYLCKQLLM